MRAHSRLVRTYVLQLVHFQARATRYKAREKMHGRKRRRRSDGRVELEQTSTTIDRGEGGRRRERTVECEIRVAELGFGSAYTIGFLLW